MIQVSGNTITNSHSFKDELAKNVNTIANGIFGNRDTKEIAQFRLLEMIMAACKQYQHDEDFRRWIDYVGVRENQMKMKEAHK